MKVLSIDIETFSSVDLSSTNVYKYVESDDFEVLLFAYVYDDEEPKVIDIAGGEQIPAFVLSDLFNKQIIKTAWNAEFELICLGKHLGKTLDYMQWRDSMVIAKSLNLPHRLADCATVLNGVQEQKDARGKQLIKKFSEVNSKGERTRREDDLAAWAEFKEYCKKDVIVERAIRTKLERFNLSEKEWYNWFLDTHINRRGVMIDREFVEKAIEYKDFAERQLTQEALMLSGLSSLKSPKQLVEWLASKGVVVENADKKTVEYLLSCELQPDVRRVLEIKQQISKSSLTKYDTMLDTATSDGRIKGMLNFMGASRTGRWAGRGVQPQNLPRNYVSPDELIRLRNEVKSGTFKYSSDLLSQLIRTAFIPSKDKEFVVVDFAAIEARVLAWMAGENWVIDEFRGAGKIYERTASKMYNVDFDTITKGHPNYEYRGKGKIATLALGYAGGLGALKSMGAEGCDEELEDIKVKWRKANRKIVNFWYELEKKALLAIKTQAYQAVAPLYNSGFLYNQGDNVLWYILPSGRRLAYWNPIIEHDGKREQIKVWGSVRAMYGGKWCENVIQAIARDILAENLMKLRNCNIVMHIHDEIVMEMPKGSLSVEQVKNVMSQEIEWAKGLPLAAEGFKSDFYMKD